MAEPFLAHIPIQNFAWGSTFPKLSKNFGDLAARKHNLTSTLWPEVLAFRVPHLIKEAQKQYLPGRGTRFDVSPEWQALPQLARSLLWFLAAGKLGSLWEHRFLVFLKRIHWETRD